MSKKSPLAWCSSFIGSHFDPYDEPLTFDGLRKRIMGKVTYLFLPRYFAWNQKIQPLQRWDNMQEHFDGPVDNSWNKKGKDGCLLILRHHIYEYTLEHADYVQNVTDVDCITPGTVYFKNGRKRLGLFWLITSSKAPFVYAILKSSMFKAWCSLTANTNGDSHFTEGMWNTFPLPALTNDLKESIIEAEKNQKDLDEIIDALFNLPCKDMDKVTDDDRKNMLAEGFLETFHNVFKMFKY